MPEKTVKVTDEQLEAFEDAHDMVSDDYYGEDDIQTYAGDVTAGEAIRIMALAYVGRLDVESGTDAQ